MNRDVRPSAIFSNAILRATIIASLFAGSLGTTFSAQPAFADDGGISFGGSPHLLSGHPTVSMQSEVVKMDVHNEMIKVDC